MAVKFNHEFIERRLAEHRLRMHKLEHDLIEEILDEVQALPYRKPRASACGSLFEASPTGVPTISQEETYASRRHSFPA